MDNRNALDAKVQRLLDLEEIKTLRYRYAYGANIIGDKPGDLKAFANLFAYALPLDYYARLPGNLGHGGPRIATLGDDVRGALDDLGPAGHLAAARRSLPRGEPAQRASVYRLGDLGARHARQRARRPQGHLSELSDWCKPI